MTYVRKEVLAEGVVIYQADCRDLLPKLGRFDATVCDPPYGISVAPQGRIGSGKLARTKDYGVQEWDKQPVSADVMEMVRASGRWNIIFGGNYYECPPASCWLVWDKLNGSNDFADCELAWTNLPKAVRRISYMWNGMLRANGETRGDHPTQKPIGVMVWALQQLPAGVRTVIDPFAGSGTTGVAAVKVGLQFTGIERDPVYFDAACRRISDELRRPRLDLGEPVQQPKQEALEL